jgi:chromosome segregation ATPase
MKHHRLNALLLVAVQDKKLLGRQSRGATIQGEKAEERIEALDDAMESMKVALEAKGRELESADANLKEAEKELRRVRMELNSTCQERDLLNGKMESADELATKWRHQSKQKMEALRKERDDLNPESGDSAPPCPFHNVICVYFIFLLRLLHP